MKKGVVLVALAILSWTVAGSALAGPVRFTRAAHPQQQRAFPRVSPEEVEENRDRGERTDKNAGNGQQAVQHGEPARNAEGGAQQVPQMPAGRAGARMSLEERQKLRRQINEAGRSIYTPPGNK